MISTLRLVRLASVAIAALVVAACGGEEPAPPPPPKPPVAVDPPKPPKVERDVPPQQDKVRIENEKGVVFEATSEADIDLPAGFPQDVPLYPGGAITVALSVPGGGVMASFETKDAPKKILDFYQRELAKQGWKVGKQKRLGATTQFESRKQGLRLSTAIVEGDPANKLTLTVIE